ncbi:MAG: hypothetical protein ABEL76_12570 [Bradymonadaceae bacterium]
MTDEIDDALRSHVVDGTERADVDASSAVARAADSDWTRLLCALAGDPEIHRTWASARDADEMDALGRLVWVRAETEEVDGAIDASLETDASTDLLDSMARAGVGWVHDALAEAATDGEQSVEAAMVAALGEPAQLRGPLMHAEVVELAGRLLRVAAAARAGELWDQFLVWRGRLEEMAERDESDPTLEDRWLRRLDGAAACLDRTLYARGALTGDYRWDWIDQPELVGDFLQLYGPTDWLEVLGFLEVAHSPAYELAAHLAVGAADGVGIEPPREAEVETLFELLASEPSSDGSEGGDWERLASDAGLRLQVALGGEEFGRLLAQSAAHERLVTHGVHSPGVPGLPLSCTSESYLETEAVEEVTAELVDGDVPEDERIVASVRTLCDARDWYLRRDAEVGDLVRDVARAFGRVDAPAVELAREQLERTLEGERTAPAATLAGALDDGRDGYSVLADQAASHERTLGMDCARRLAAVGDRPALERLGELWAVRGPVLRAPFFREVLRDGLEVLD